MKVKFIISLVAIVIFANIYIKNDFNLFKYEYNTPGSEDSPVSQLWPILKTIFSIMHYAITFLLICDKMNNTQFRLFMEVLFDIAKYVLMVIGFVFVLQYLLKS